MFLRNFLLSDAEYNGLQNDIARNTLLWKRKLRKMHKFDLKNRKKRNRIDFTVKLVEVNPMAMRYIFIASCRISHLGK